MHTVKGAILEIITKSPEVTESRLRRDSDAAMCRVITITYEYNLSLTRSSSRLRNGRTFILFYVTIMFFLLLLFVSPPFEATRALIRFPFTAHRHLI